KLIRVISPDDIQKILTYSKKHEHEMYRIIFFALYTGCRREEIVKLRYEDIKDGCITIHGKGNKERLIPLVDKVYEVLHSQDVGRIFEYQHTSTLTNYFRRICSVCKVSARFHDLRHTAATQMISSGIPIEVVKAILGHVELRTTQIYAQVVADKMRQEMSKLKY
ncbi:MAG: site-specific integrase, partial [Desulfamplus sp.]|nr:site-specific integrase [Desulfamplus sp.]